MRTSVCLVPQMCLLSSMKLQPKGIDSEAVIGMFLQRLETFLWPDVGREDRGLVKWAMDEENENMQGEMDVSKEGWSLEFSVLGYREGTVWSVSEVLALTASEQVRCWGKALVLPGQHEGLTSRPRRGEDSAQAGMGMSYCSSAGEGLESKKILASVSSLPVMRRRCGVLVTALTSA